MLHGCLLCLQSLHQILHFGDCNFIELDCLSVDSIPIEGGFILSESDNFHHAVETKIAGSEIYESDRLVSFLAKVADNEATESENTWPAYQRRVQKQWCCALCLVSAMSKNYLIKHLEEKKHNAKEEDLILYKLTKKINGRSPPMFKKRNGILIENLNHLAMNLENCCKFLNPVIGPITLCKWEKPNNGWTKLNTDGSIDPKSAGFGGLLRDFRGDPICSFISKAPTDDVFLVELWAVWRGLVLAWGLGIKVIQVESDSLSVMKNINKTQSHNPLAITFTCLNHIWELLGKVEKCKVSHSWRETNAAADYLSKINLSGNDVVLWLDNFPDKLRRIIEDDARGRAYFGDNS